MSWREETPEEIQEEEYITRAREAFHKRAKPVTHGELVKAIETVARSYGANGTHDSDLIAGAFKKLAEELK